MKIIICGALVLLFVYLFDFSICAENDTVSSKCSAKRFRRTDQAVVKLISLGKQGRDLPANFSMVKPYCDETNQLLRKIDSFVKECYEKKVQNVASVFIFTVRNTIKQYCAKKRSKKLIQLVDMGACINEHLIKEDECIVQFVNQTKQLITLEDDSKKIPHTCCYYLESMKCVDRYIEAVPCIAKNEQILMDFVRSLFGPLVDLMCGDYNDSNNKCQLLGPAPKSTETNLQPHNYSSFIFAITELLKSMKEFDLFT